MIASITSSRGIATINNKDHPLAASVHNNTTYLTMICFQKYVSLAPIDNRSTVNVYY